jgi:hypothetical protein
MSNGAVGPSEYARASVLYSLYACGHLKITDIEYPTYYNWCNAINITLEKDSNGHAYANLVVVPNQ